MGGLTRRDLIGALGWILVFAWATLQAPQDTRAADRVIHAVSTIVH